MELNVPPYYLFFYYPEEATKVYNLLLGAGYKANMRKWSKRSTNAKYMVTAELNVNFFNKIKPQIQ